MKANKNRSITTKTIFAIALCAAPLFALSSDAECRAIGFVERGNNIFLECAGGPQRSLYVRRERLAARDL
jgi:hypothetical protein